MAAIVGYKNHWEYGFKTVYVSLSFFLYKYINNEIVTKLLK